jgi:hypothetical protein
MHPRLYPTLLLASLIVLSTRPAAAQPDGQTFEAGVQVAGAVSSEFDSTDVGFGGRVAWHPATVLGIEGEIDLYSGTLGDDAAFSGGRLEGLFGATIGPRLGRLRPFARVRPGFVQFREASEPIVCILIFPPPLRCTLAAGRTVFAFDLGGGVEWLPSGRTFLRFDAGDRMIRYPTVSHDFRFALGGGVRF